MSNTLFTAAQRAERCTLSLEQAVYHACKAERGTLGRISEIYGVNYNTLALQVNPNRTSHTLDPHTIELVLEHTQDIRILDAVCCAHGNAGWFLLPDAEANSEVMGSIAEMGQRFADMNATSLGVWADRVITQDEYNELEKVGFALIAQVKTILDTAKQNMENSDDY